MAVRVPTKTDNQNDTFTVLWEQLTDTGPDSGTPIGLSEFPIKTVQVVGDFTTSGAVTIQGSNDGGTTWATLRDQLGVALVLTTSAPRIIAENTLLIRPLCTAGSSVDMDVYVNCTRDASLIVPGWLNDNLLYQAEVSVESTAAAMVTGTTIFTITGGPIRITDLVSYCVTANGATASTLQWSADGTVGSATTFSGASGSLANFAAGGIVYNNFTALTTAPVITQTAGVALYGPTTSTGGGIYVPAGIITTTIGVGSTTGTWKHYMRYKPLGTGVTVTAS